MTSWFSCIFLLLYVILNFSLGHSASLEDIPLCFPPTNFDTLPVCVYVDPKFQPIDNELCGFSIDNPCNNIKSTLRSIQIFYQTPSNGCENCTETTTESLSDIFTTGMTGDSYSSSSSDEEIYNTPTVVMYLFDGNYTGINNTNINYFGKSIYILPHHNASDVIFSNPNIRSPIFLNEHFYPTPIPTSSSTTTTGTTGGISSTTTTSTLTNSTSLNSTDGYSTTKIFNNVKRNQKEINNKSNNNINININNNNNNNNNTSTTTNINNSTNDIVKNIKSILKIYNIQFQNINELVHDNNNYTSEVFIRNCTILNSGYYESYMEKISSNMIKLESTNSFTVEDTIFVGNQGTMIDSYGSDLSLKNVTFQQIMGVTSVIHSMNDKVMMYQSEIRDCAGTYNCLFNGTLLNITDCTFRSNSAMNGGAVYLTNSSVNIRSSVFEGNRCYGNYGGAIYSVDAQGQYPLEVLSCTFRNNQVIPNLTNNTSYGGSIYVSNCKYFSLYLSNFSISHADIGGVLYMKDIHRFNAGYNQFFNTTTSNGTVYSEGSNIYLFASTLYSNTADLGTFIYCNRSYVYLQNTIDYVHPKFNNNSIYCPYTCKLDGDVDSKICASESSSSSDSNSNNSTSKSKSPLRKAILITVISIASVTTVILFGVVARISYHKFRYYQATKKGYKIIL